MGITPNTTPYAHYLPSSNFTNTSSNHLLTGNQAINGAKNSSAATNVGDETSQKPVLSFDNILSLLLPAGQEEKIDEEKLFSALIEERVTSLKGTEAATAYHQHLETHKAEMTRADGYIPEEDAARAALQDLVKTGTLSNDEAEKIHAQAFQAAQIDNNTDALYDGFGATMAVTHVKLALQTSSEKMAMFDSGMLEAGLLSLDFSQNAPMAEISSTNASLVNPSRRPGEFVGGEGFLFKPVSEGNGNLAILLPSSMSKEVSDVNIRDRYGAHLESGDRSGNFDDGRPIFRFNQAGEEYPDSIVVSVHLNDGRTKEYNIPNPALRYE